MILCTCFYFISTTICLHFYFPGIGQAIGTLTKYDERDLLMQDFMTVETTHFAKGGSSQTPAHSFRYVNK